MKVETPIKKRVASPEIIRREAISLAETEGWTGLTVRSLSKRIGYKPPILYQHFKSKDDLLMAIMNEGFERLINEMEAAAARAAHPEQALVAVARARFDFALKNSTLHSLMFSSGGPFWQRQIAFQGMRPAEILVGGLIQKISGRIDSCPDLVTHFVALIKGYTYFATEMPADQACRNFFPNQSPGQALEAAIDRFIASIIHPIHE